MEDGLKFGQIEEDVYSVLIFAISMNPEELIDEDAMAETQILPALLRKKKRILKEHEVNALIECPILKLNHLYSSPIAIENESGGADRRRRFGGRKNECYPQSSRSRYDEKKEPLIPLTTQERHYIRNVRIKPVPRSGGANPLVVSFFLGKWASGSRNWIPKRVVKSRLSSKKLVVCLVVTSSRGVAELRSETGFRSE
ncbi:hypothetical protein L5515_000095 [Caenorhabditis briggsae]|uniref:Uncharacterized protein n=1 Tax=Caenorhabditis briggsae TaxID=6238 RepID=A0AAE9DZ00_CAEBR|nr:hypothetical protein L5515_000095 [Caenorhabditis briggsae]